MSWCKNRKAAPRTTSEACDLQRRRNTSCICQSGLRRRRGTTDFLGASRRFFLRGGGFVLGGSGVRRIHMDVMLTHLLFQRNNVRKIQCWSSGERPLYEFEPDGQCGARAGFFLAK